MTNMSSQDSAIAIDAPPPPPPPSFNPNEHILQLKSREGTKDYLPVQWRLVWFREKCPQGTIDTEELEFDLDREVEAEIYAWNPEKRRSEKTIKKARGYARYRAVVTDGRGGRATGTKSEDAANFADFGEKAETGAIGRALAALGYGTQFAPEFNEEHRIVDSPVERPVSPLHEPEELPSPPSITRTPVTPQHNSNGSQSTASQRASASLNNPATNPRAQVLVRPATAPVPPQPSQSPSQTSSQPPPVQGGITEQQILSITKLCEHLGKDVPPNLGQMTFEQAKGRIESLTGEYRQMRSQVHAQEGEKEQEQTTPVPPPQDEQAIMDEADRERVLSPWEQRLGPHGFASVVQENARITTERDLWTVGEVHRIVRACTSWYGTASPLEPAPDHSLFAKWASEKITREQADEWKKMMPLFGREPLSKLIGRYCPNGKKAVTLYNRGELDHLLGILRVAHILIEQAQEWDSHYTKLEKDFGVKHPLELFMSKREDEQERIQVYRQYLYQKTQSLLAAEAA